MPGRDRQGGSLSQPRGWRHRVLQDARGAGGQAPQAPQAPQEAQEAQEDPAGAHPRGGRDPDGGVSLV